MTILKKTVTLNPGEAKTVNFTYKPIEPGYHWVTVDGLTGYILARSEEPPPRAIAVGVGIYDEVNSQYVAGTVGVNGQEYSIGAGRYEIVQFVEAGSYTFNLLAIPSGYEFDRWAVYDWSLEGTPLILETSELPLQLAISQDTFIHAIVVSTIPAGEPATLHALVEEWVSGAPNIKIPNALVSVGERWSGITNESGVVRIEGIEPGSYTVTISATGYRTGHRIITFAPGEIESRGFLIWPL